MQISEDRVENRSSAHAEPIAVSTKDIAEVAKTKLGFPSLRPGQEEAIRAVVEGNDTLVVAPTGSGKSAIYQIAGLMIAGSVVVVSPLIALQKDQVDALRAAESVGPAVVLNSTRKASELKKELQSIRAGQVKFIFLAPEQLAKEETVKILAEAGVGLLVVDEAHCVSEWGHDFRPDYGTLGHVIEQLKHPTVLAMTATASNQVREEIAKRLCMKDPVILVGGFDRPNICLRVDRFDEQDNKLEGLLHRVRWAEKPGIIYVCTRNEAESIMAGLEEEGIKALFYHGGMKASERERVQDEFMSGAADVIVATNAFGMGIDKENVRFVYHFDSPDSLDAYYQEIGRAGRDGERSEAILFFREQDIGTQAFHTGQIQVDRQAFESISQALATSTKAVSKRQLEAQTGIATRKLIMVLQQMEDAGLVRHLKSGAFRLNRIFDLDEAVAAADERQQQWKERNKARLEQMREYADTGECRRALLLRYFGDRAADTCANCDNCEAKGPAQEQDSSAGTRLEVVA